MGQMIEQAVNATKSLDQKGIAKYLREHTHKTIVGSDQPMPTTASGSRARRSRRNSAASRTRTSISSAQAGKQVILFPDNLKTGELVSPFEAARK